MADVVVGSSDCKISADPADVVQTYGLGSCLGVALYDRGKRVGGILHVPLPSSSLGPTPPHGNPYMYVDTGLAAFLHDLASRGTSPGALEAYLAGAGDLFQASGLMDIGGRNAREALAALSAAGIPVRGSSTGGVFGRSMSLRIHDGQVVVWKGRGVQEIL